MPKKKTEKICPICGKSKDTGIVDTCMTSYLYVLERIKEDHPDWVESDGACPQCLEYYKNLSLPSPE